MGMAGESPDVIIGCTGGGSNFAGLTFPFLGRNFRDGAKHRIIAVEPEAAPSLTRGVYAYDFGDTGKMAPIVKMHTLGHDFIPEPIHAGGLRYHGMSPLVSLLKEHGYIEARSVHQRASFEAGVTVRPRRRHPAGAGADPRDPGRDRRGPGGQGSRRGAGHPVQPVRSRTLRPVGLRALPRRQPRGLRIPAREGRGRAGGPAQGLTRASEGMPQLSCCSCGRQIYTVSPLEALFAEERRCPRCGTPMQEERRETGAPDDDPAREPGERPGTAAGTDAGRADAPDASRRPRTGARGREPTRRSPPRSRRSGRERAPARRSPASRRRGSGTPRPAA